MSQGTWGLLISSARVCGVFYSTQQGSSLQWHFHPCPTRTKPPGTSAEQPPVTAALSRHYCNASFPITGFLWTRFCEHNGTKSPREIQGRGSLSWPSPTGEATWGRTAKSMGTAEGDTAATQPGGHPWGSREMTIEWKRL